eukprot:7781333-Pyramimonas_sp.AAC.1
MALVRYSPSRSPRRSGAWSSPASSCPAGLCTGTRTPRCGPTSIHCRSRRRPDSVSGVTWTRASLRATCGRTRP